MRYSGLLIMIWSTELMAESSTQQMTAIDPVSPTYMMKLTLGLVAVVAIIFAIAWMLKRFNITQQSQSGIIKVVAGLPLGTRDRIVLLQVGSEQILVGLSPGRMEKLHTLSDPVKVEEIKPQTASFAQKVNELMGKARETEK